MGVGKGLGFPAVGIVVLFCQQKWGVAVAVAVLVY